MCQVQLLAMLGLTTRVHAAGGGVVGLAEVGGGIKEELLRRGAAARIPVGHVHRHYRRGRRGQSGAARGRHRDNVLPRNGLGDADDDVQGGRMFT